MPRIKSEQKDANDIYTGIEDLSLPGATISIKRNIGQLDYIMTIKNVEQNFELKMQIESCRALDIIFLLRSKDISEPTAQTLVKTCQEQVDQELENATGSAYIECFYKHLVASLLTVGSLVSGQDRSAASSNKSTKPSSSKKTSNKNKKSSSSSNNACGPDENDTGSSARAAGSGKQVSMKTADDVIKRILWDKQINQDDIVVGYIDRFLGIVEKPFRVFSWEDLASMDYYTFGIPKHRICYFLYRKALIWHKNSRLDRVFGSRGSNQTIVDVIANYRDDVEDQFAYILKLEGEGASEEHRVQPDSSDGADPMMSQSHHRYTDDVDYDYSSEEDDGVQVVIQSQDRAAGDSLSSEEDETPRSNARGCGSGISGEARNYWRDKLRPNFFICVKVDSEEIIERVKEIQVNRSTVRAIGNKDIPEYLYSDLLESNSTSDADVGTAHRNAPNSYYFGEQPIKSVYLCSMEKERREDGFYITPGCISFNREILTNSNAVK